MITVHKLKVLTELPAVMLTMGIQSAGHPKHKFTTAQFIGISNGGEFCYRTTRVKEGEDDTVNVFVKYDPAADKVSVSY